jgi:glycosyltransferase involved in cell wall biosynthesis
MRETTVLVIPCYNEARRLDAPALEALAGVRPGLSLLLVDDGSTDDTAARLQGIRSARPGAVEVLRLPRNEGKAEAVRRGLLAALAAGADVVGFADADLATPPEELLRMVDELAARGDVAVLLGARVQLLGTHIERYAWRHYLGRVFATFASIGLRLPVYDTQCGAKLFRAGPALERALSRPFRSRWIFDVELLDRLLRGEGGDPVPPERLREFPLAVWRDIPGSTLGPLGMLRAGLEVLAFAARARLGARRPAGDVSPAVPSSRRDRATG